MNEEFQLYLTKWEDYLLIKVLLSKELLDLATLKEIYQESHSVSNQDIRLGRLLLKKRLIKDMDYVKAMASVREYAKEVYENGNQQLQQELLQIQQIMESGAHEQQKTVMIDQSYAQSNQNNFPVTENIVQTNDAQINVVQTTVAQQEADQDDSHCVHNQNEPSYPDKKFSSYEILGEIARGGMGIVYKAKQLNLNRIVALKVLLTGGVATPTEIKRFRQEAEIAGSLQHPYIVSIYEVGEYNHYHYFTMDYIPGDTLKVHIKKHSRRKNLLKILVKISEALQYAHEHNIIHRDIKPSNIIVTPEWEPKLTDFGLAKRIDEKSDIPEEGHTLGTPFYLSPEQARGDKNIDGRTDIYSMGVILYEILTGQVPFRSNTLMELYNRIMNEEPISPRRINKRIDKNISTICLKAMSKDPDERYQTAQELADDLSRYLKGEPILAKAPSQFKKIVSYTKKNPKKVIKNAVLFLCLTILIVGLLLFFPTSNVIDENFYTRLEDIHIKLLQYNQDAGKNKDNFNDFIEKNRLVSLAKDSLHPNSKNNFSNNNQLIDNGIIYGLACLTYHQYDEAKKNFQKLKEYDVAYGYYWLGMVALVKSTLDDPNIKSNATNDAIFNFDKAIQSVNPQHNGELRSLWNAYMQRSFISNGLNNSKDGDRDLLSEAVRLKTEIIKNIKDIKEQLESNKMSEEQQNENTNRGIRLCNEILWNYLDTTNNSDIEEILLYRAKFYRIAKKYKPAKRDIELCAKIALDKSDFQYQSEIQQEKKFIEQLNKDSNKDSKQKENSRNTKTKK